MYHSVEAFTISILCEINLMWSWNSALSTVQSMAPTVRW